MHRGEKEGLLNTRHRLPSTSDNGHNDDSSVSTVLLFDAQCVVAEIVALGDGCIDEIEFR